MFRFSGLKLCAVLLVALICLAGYDYASAVCGQNWCKNINTSCVTDGDGLASMCYQYQNSSTSCWTCGIGSPARGFCDSLNADPNLVCKEKTPVLTYKKYAFCTRTCGAIANVYMEASSLTMMQPGSFNETQWLCDVSGSN